GGRGAGGGAGWEGAAAALGRRAAAEGCGGPPSPSLPLPSTWIGSSSTPTPPPPPPAAAAAAAAWRRRGGACAAPLCSHAKSGLESGTDVRRARHGVHAVGSTPPPPSAAGGAGGSEGEWGKAALRWARRGARGTSARAVWSSSARAEVACT